MRPTAAIPTRLRAAISTICRVGRLVPLIAAMAPGAESRNAETKPAPSPKPALSRTVIDKKWADRATITAASPPPAERMALWYARPAAEWNEALPLGNGKLGAMVFGGVADERVQLNVDSLWDGYPVDPNQAGGSASLPAIRQQLFNGEIAQAVAEAKQSLLGRPPRILSYQSLGELWIESGHTGAVTGYQRSLDLDRAIATTTWTIDGVSFTRELFCSAPDEVLVLRLTASQPGAISFAAGLRRQHSVTCAGVVSDAHALQLSGRIDTQREKEPDRSARAAKASRPGSPEAAVQGVAFAAVLKALPTGGSVSVAGDRLIVTEADAITLLIAGATSHPGLANLTGPADAIDPVASCRTWIGAAESKAYDRLRADHVTDHQRLFRRVDIDLGTTPADIAACPTDARVSRLQEDGRTDPDLVEMLYQFGRYLLIGSSRPGSMPANLQGIWGWQLAMPWNGDFHTNVHLQMNYWPSESANLPELHLPLFDLMDALVKPGSRTAEVTYGARGWVVHHLTDAWGYTAPADGIWGIWPLGGAWLALHPWEHYQYTCDETFLRTRAWPLMRGAARFILDFLTEAPAGSPAAGFLVTNPSHSPENSFALPTGERHMFTSCATMDVMIIRDLLQACIEASTILQTDAAFRQECEHALAKLPPIRISQRTGGIQEWIEDYAEPDPKHRHTSHLFGVFPGRQITPEETPDLARAAAISLEARGETGDARHSWTWPWRCAIWARLKAGGRAHEMISGLMRYNLLPNLMTTYPPFQIDGYFGMTAAVSEMLLQSHLRREGVPVLDLLPALPAAWPQGQATGLRARGGVEVDLHWKDGALVQTRFLSDKGGKFHIKAGPQSTTITLKPKEALSLDQALKASTAPREGTASP